MNCVRYTFMLVRRGTKPTSSFVGGRALRAKMDIWQDGHTDALRTECGLDTMSDVNMAVPEILHEIHDIFADDVNGCLAVQRSPTRELSRCCARGKSYICPHSSPPGDSCPVRAMSFWASPASTNSACASTSIAPSSTNRLYAAWARRR
jgi:hypothetical protein